MADPLIEESVAASNIPEASNFVDGPWEMRASDRLINYNVVVRELDPRKRGSRELELKRLGLSGADGGEALGAPGALLTNGRWSKFSPATNRQKGLRRTP